MKLDVDRPSPQAPPRQRGLKLHFERTNRKTGHIRGLVGQAGGEVDNLHLVAHPGRARWHRREVATARVRNAPGELLRTARRLSASGINIPSVCAMGTSEAGMHEVVFRTDDARAARKALEG